MLINANEPLPFYLRSSGRIDKYPPGLTPTCASGDYCRIWQSFTKGIPYSDKGRTYFAYLTHPEDLPTCSIDCHFRQMYEHQYYQPENSRSKNLDNTIYYRVLEHYSVQQLLSKHSPELRLFYVQLFAP